MHRMSDAPTPSHLRATPAIDADHPDVQAFARQHAQGANERERAVALTHAVRDGFRYDPYRIDLSPAGMRASTVLANGYGWCVPKAALLAAVARAAGIPARLGFADVRNHLSTERLRQLVGGDVYRWHGYVAMYLEGRWVKATPAFNLQMCERFDVHPLEFDGRADSLMHPYNARDERHMEYVKERGTFDDFPFEALVADMWKHHPGLVEAAEADLKGDFEHEAMVDR